MPPKKQETSSPKMAKIAAKVLNTGKATVKEAKSLAGSVLTNAADKKPPAKPAAKKSR